MEKVLIITTNSGFVPQFEMNDVTILEENGFEIHYASNFHKPVYATDKEALKKRGIRLHHIGIEKSPLHIFKNLKAYRALKAIIEKEQIDLVHCHNPIGGVLGRMAASRSRRKPCVIYTAHGFHFYKGAPCKNWLLYYCTERFLARRTDVLITINQEDYKRARRFRLKKGGRVEQIHGVGVDINRFKPNEALRAEKREELGIPENAFHIVSVGELNHNKNHRVVLEAIAMLPQTDIYYTVCGKGKTRNDLVKLAEKKRLTERVKLPGYRTDVEEILQTADCFVFPSIREGFGIAAVEALACGVPVIAADNRGTREYMINRVNGIICASGKKEEFARALAKLYDDPEYRKMLAGNCRKSVSLYTLDEADKSMRRIYANAIEKKES